MFCVYLSVIFVVLNICNAALLGPSNRCAISNAECQKNFFQIFQSNYAKKGIPEIGVPIFDPLVLQNVTVTFKDIITVTMLEGEAVGIGNCVITRYETDIETKMKESDFTCDLITIQGTYKLTTGSFLKRTIGNLIDSEGYISFSFEQWSMNVSYPFEVEKHENGDVFIRCLFDDAQYEQGFGNIKTQLSNITTGNEIAGQGVVDFANANWKSLINSFGRYFGDKAVEYYFNVHEKFFNNVPAKYYITDDLRSYVSSTENEKEE